MPKAKGGIRDFNPFARFYKSHAGGRTLFEAGVKGDKLVIRTGTVGKKINSSELKKVGRSQAVDAFYQKVKQRLQSDWNLDTSISKYDTEVLEALMAPKRSADSRLLPKGTFEFSKRRAPPPVSPALEHSDFGASHRRVYHADDDSSDSNSALADDELDETVDDSEDSAKQSYVSGTSSRRSKPRRRKKSDASLSSAPRKRKKKADARVRHKRKRPKGNRSDADDYYSPMACLDARPKRIDGGRKGRKKRRSKDDSFSEASYLTEEEKRSQVDSARLGFAESKDHNLGTPARRGSPGGKQRVAHLRERVEMETTDGGMRSPVREGPDDEDSYESGGSSHSECSSGRSQSTAGSSASGRQSDEDYEMNYETMSVVMRKALTQPLPKDLNWRPLKRWIRWDNTVDDNAFYALAPMDCRIAGSCHELMVVYMRPSMPLSSGCSPLISPLRFDKSESAVAKSQVLMRLLKLARDPEEDNEHHFRTEREVAQYLSQVASAVNHCFHLRTDVCVWPVETVYFEYRGEMKFATIQPPFLPRVSSNYVFVKIEPNSGRRCHEDHAVGRYQHCFAAVTRGLNLVRDWQGYGVSHECFFEVCADVHVLDSVLKQVRRRKRPKQTKVLVMIDPVLTTTEAHYENNNPTDFGMKAIGEWLQQHDCDASRCKHLHLERDIRFGLADSDQRFFAESAPEKVRKTVAALRRRLQVWCGSEEDGDSKDEEEDID